MGTTRPLRSSGMRGEQTFPRAETPADDGVHTVPLQCSDVPEQATTSDGLAVELECSTLLGRWCD